MPTLASQSKEAIEAAMKKFKSGERPSTIMGRLAKGYSDAEITAMAEFFSKQKLHPTNQTLDKAKIAKGASLQESNCGRCHIEDGKEGKDDTPVMASQWLPYMQMQMTDYLSGKRKMPEKMKEKVDPLVAADRLRRLQELQAAHTRERLSARVGREVDVLVEGASARDPGMRCGRTPCNKTVNFHPGSAEGPVRSVLVTGAGTHSLLGKERPANA